MNFLYNLIQLYINAKTRSRPTNVWHCIILLLIYSSMFSLMMAIYSRNMQLICTQIKLCLDCDLIYFLFSLYVHNYNTTGISCLKICIPVFRRVRRIAKSDY